MIFYFEFKFKKENFSHSKFEIGFSGEKKTTKILYNHSFFLTLYYQNVRRESFKKYTLNYFNFNFFSSKVSKT